MRVARSACIGLATVLVGLLPPGEPTNAQAWGPADVVSLAENLTGEVAGVAFLDRELFVAEWDGKASRVHHYRPDGTWAGTVGEPGRAPGQLAYARHLFAFGRDRLAVLDQKTYRMSYFSAAAHTFEGSFLFSHYAFAPIGAVGAAEVERHYLFALEEPEVWGFSSGGELVFTLDLFGRELRERNLLDYQSTIGTVDPEGNLLYARRAIYSIAQVAPDGTEIRRFGEPGPAYRAPGSLPTTFGDNPAALTRWEESVSWIDRIAVSAGRILVAYDAPRATAGGRPSWAADVYDLDGQLLAESVALAGRLLAADRAGRLALFRNDDKALVLIRLEQLIRGDRDWATERPEAGP